jgi:hypothetical protein
MVIDSRTHSPSPHRTPTAANGRRCRFPRYSPLLDLLLRHPLFRLLLILRPPPRQRRSTIHDIANSPQHPLLVQLFRDIIVRTQNVEFPVRHLLVHEVRDLRSGPRTIGLLLI